MRLLSSYVLIYNTSIYILVSHGIFIISLIALWSMTSVVWAADIVFMPNTGSYTVGQLFTTAVQIAPDGENINSGEASIKFNPNLLSVVSVNKDNSLFSLCTTEPKISNITGTITFDGFTPTPFSTQSNIVTITFKAAAAGTANIIVSSASVLAANENGIDVYKNSINGSYTITAADASTTVSTTLVKLTIENTSSDSSVSNNKSLITHIPKVDS